MPTPLFAPRWTQRALIIAFVASVGIVFVFHNSSTTPIMGAGIIGTIIILGGLFPRSGILGQPLIGFRNTQGKIALTFDDGPDPEVTSHVLELLRRYRQRATFFVIGEKLARYPELGRKIVDEGHQLANHSWRHRWWLAFRHPRRIVQELRQTQQAIDELAMTPQPFLFRPPIALVTPRLAIASHQSKFTIVAYSARAYDHSPFANARRCYKRLTRNLDEGAILLMHDAAPRTNSPALVLQYLPNLLEALHQKNLQSVPLNKFFNPPHHS